MTLIYPHQFLHRQPAFLVEFHEFRLLKKKDEVLL